jgi:hypothetical protein
LQLHYVLYADDGALFTSYRLSKHESTLTV